MTEDEANEKPTLSEALGLLLDMMTDLGEHLGQVIARGRGSDRSTLDQMTLEDMRDMVTLFEGMVKAAKRVAERTDAATEDRKRLQAELARLRRRGTIGFRPLG